MELERRQLLLSIVENSRKAYREWIEHGDSTIVPEDGIYQRFQEIADQAKLIYRPRAEPLELLFVAFAPHWQAFVSAQQTTSDATMLPGPDLWAAWEALSAANLQAKMPRLKRVESIAELIEQKVPRAQIAKIYGFLDEEGAADFQQLQEEIDKPGTHTAKGWIAPVNRHLASQIRQMEIEAEALDNKRAAKVAAATTPAKESIEQLVASGVSAMQISRLRKISVEDVFAYCRDHNLPEPPYDYTATLQAPAAHDPEISAERRQQMEALGKNTSPQLDPADFVPPRHPMTERPDLGGRVTGPVGVPEEDDDAADELPNGLDLASLPPDEANAIQEAVAYFQQGMDVSAIAQAMSIHGNKVRGHLKKAGLNPEQHASET